MFYVYEWFIVDTNEIIYVGKGTRNRYKFRQHNKLFNEMIERYECSSRIIKEFENEKDAFQYEHDRIVELKEKGQCICNINPGGYGGTLSWWTDERRDWYSKNNAMKDIKQRKRMSVNNPMKNKEISKRVAEKHARKVCVEDKVYDSFTHAAEAYNVSPQAFAYWMKRGYTNGHERCYYYGEKPKELNILVNNWVAKRRPIIIDGVYYESIILASKTLGLCQSGITLALQQNRTYKGHTCQYGNQQPSQGNFDDCTLEGSTTNA